jgi:hypothetical protein
MHDLLPMDQRQGELGHTMPPHLLTYEGIDPLHV